MKKRHPNRFSQSVEDKIIKMHDTGKSATEIGKTLNKHTSSITRVIRRYGRTLNRVYQGKGKEHSQWKGGRSINGQAGYWTIYSNSHPRRKKNNRVFEHIVVAEKKYGHPIKRETPIHHIDFDRLNNDPDNLYLCNGHTEHRNLHISLEEVARELFRQGKLGFKDGNYYWK